MHTPTDEQVEFLDAAGSGEHVVARAYAGCAKTTSLVMAAEGPLKAKRVGYRVFNAKMAAEAANKFPYEVDARTIHKTATDAYMTPALWARLRAGQAKPSELAKTFRIDPIFVDRNNSRKRLAPGWLVGVINKMLTNFEQSGDLEVGRQHMPFIDALETPQVGLDGQPVRRRGPNHDEVATQLLPHARRFWADLQNDAGPCQFRHSTYLKRWALTNPHLGLDVLMWDEAQDASGVMQSIVRCQTDTQIIAVGDDYQQIYGWAGAINALDTFGGRQVFLSQSFRFGPELAELANIPLAQLGAPTKLIGVGRPTDVGCIEFADAELYRTNSATIAAAMGHMAAGRTVCLVGGSEPFVRFARAVKDLQDKGFTSHPDLSIFSSWDEVTQYVDEDVNGGDLRTMVNLVAEYGTDGIIKGLANIASEEDPRGADVTLSTAHKAKGLEWPAVKIGPDFPDPSKRPLGDEDIRLLYVAVTRGQRAIDVTRVPYFNPPTQEAP